MEPEPALPLGMLMILPKGFVENTDEVYAEVAAYSIIPADELIKYWKGTVSILPSSCLWKASSLLSLADTFDFLQCTPPPTGSL